jgi:hypothetical protein
MRIFLMLSGIGVCFYLILKGVSLLDSKKDKKENNNDNCCGGKCGCKQ